MIEIISKSDIKKICDENSHPITRNKLVVKGFWRQAQSRSDRIFLLVEYAKLSLPKRYPLTYSREKFNSIKKSRFWPKCKRHCFACWTAKATLLHHIIQLSRGGVNVKKNIVQLCHNCHAIVHPWLNLKAA